MLLLPFPILLSLLKLNKLVVLYGPRGEDEQGLQEIAQDQPPPAPRADEVRQLAGEVPACQEQAQGDGDVGCVEGVAVEGGDDEGDGEEDGVACLVGGEAVVVWEGDCVCFYWEGEVRS